MPRRLKLRKRKKVAEDVQINTEGDDRVCVLCDELEQEIWFDGDPDIPDIPVHPNCRCELVDADTGDVVSEINRVSRIRVFETIDALIKDGAFSWAPNLGNLRELATKNNGHFLLIQAIHPMKTDPFNMGHGTREWTARELLATTRTAIGKGANLNHRYELHPQYEHVVQDAEYNDSTKASELIMWETDPEIIRLIKEGYITKVSIQGGLPRRTQEICTSCGTSGCKCHTRVEGVVLGEDDGQAFAYVVTKPGATYWGRSIEAASPGDWNSDIRIAETNTNSRSGLIAFYNMVDSKTLEVIIRAAADVSKKWPQLQEAVKTPEKFIKVKEDLQAFNDAINSGDAMRAMLILAGDVYNASAQQAVQQQTEQAPPAAPANAPPAAPAGAAPPAPPPAEDPEEEKKKKKMDELVTAKVAEAVAKIDLTKVVAEVQKLVEPRMAELLKNMPEIASIKESMKNLSGQVEETFREVKASSIGKPARAGIKETNEAQKDWDQDKAREIARMHLPVN